MELKSWEECTPAQREFIGTTFPTPKGGVLEVVGCCVKSGRHVMFKVECSICSADEELFPEGFSSEKSNLVKGQVPCGCAKNPRWNESQYKVLVERECVKRNYKFLGWGEEFVGTYTKLHLHNLDNGNIWNTTNMDGFLNNGRGCPVAKATNTRNSQRKPYDVVVKQLTEICNTEGHTFISLPEYKSNCDKFNWVCSKGHNCETSVANFLNGGNRCKTCRYLSTGDRFRKPYDVVVEQLTEICNTEGHSFVSIPEYKNTSSKLKWVCNKGHNCDSIINDFLSGKRCRTCADLNSGFNGFYKDRIHEQDYLYIYKIKGQPYIKVGRTFRPKERLKENQSRINKYYGNRKHKITQTHLFTGTHEEIYNLEQSILSKEFVVHSVDLDDGYGSSELLHESCYDAVVAFVEQWEIDRGGVI